MARRYSSTSATAGTSTRLPARFTAIYAFERDGTSAG